jgi:hypothetical protein
MYRTCLAAAILALSAASTANAQQGKNGKIELYDDAGHLDDVGIPARENDVPYTFKCYRPNPRPGDSNEFFDRFDDRATKVKIHHEGGHCRIIFYERDSGSKDEDWLEIFLFNSSPETTADIDLARPSRERFPINAANGQGIVGEGFYHHSGGERIRSDLSRIEIYRY